METKNNGNTQEETSRNENWQLAENNYSEQPSADESVDLRSAEAGGYGLDANDTFYATTHHDDDKERDNKEDDDDNEEENTDWGTTDPLDPPGNLPDPMDPSGPGSAV